MDIEYEKYVANWDERKEQYPNERFMENVEQFAGVHDLILETGCQSSWYTKRVPVTVHHEATTKQR